MRGGFYALKRISRCHPWAKPAFDPVPGTGNGNHPAEQQLSVCFTFRAGTRRDAIDEPRKSQYDPRHRPVDVRAGWQVFVVGPELEKEAARQQAIAEMQAEEAAADSTNDANGSNATGTTAGTTPAPSESRPADTAPRIVIDAPLVSGSISLAGLRIDDVMLRLSAKRDEDSPNISS